MGRRRIELPLGVEAEIQARTARGESADTVCAALKGTVSRSTICRMQQKLRGGGQPKQALTTLPPGTDNSSLEDAPLDVLKRLLAGVERGREAAERDGNLAALASLSQRALAIAEAIRKSTPLPVANPEDNPDYIALAKQGEERLLKLIRGLFGPVEGAEGG